MKENKAQRDAHKVKGFSSKIIIIITTEIYSLISFNTAREKNMDPQTSSHLQRASDDLSCSGDVMAEIERKKLYYLERILKEQEKTNIRLHTILESQKQNFHNHDRMIELLYRIAYNK